LSICKGTIEKSKGYLSPEKLGVSLEFLFRDWAKNVTSFFSHTSGARDLKIGMHIPHMNGSKVRNQIFDIL